jgi:hypothetical protein
LELFDGCLLFGSAGGTDALDHLGRSESVRRVHEDILGGWTDRFDKVFDTVENYLSGFGGRNHNGRVMGQPARRSSGFETLAGARSSTTGGWRSLPKSG